MKSTDEIDKIVGANLFKFRSLRGLTQGALGKAIGVTFQQVQKYEKGTNRVSSSQLWQFAEILHVPLTSFFDGLKHSTFAFPSLNKEQANLIRYYNAAPLGRVIS